MADDPSGPQAIADGGPPGGGGAARRVRALRGATTVDEDSTDQVTARTQALLAAMLERNGVDREDIISVLFTATDDIHCMFPATAARAVGFGDVPLLCARELNINGAQARCIRVMMHVETSRERRHLHHVYMEGARGLRDDLPE
jgi:chorismate mutase